MPVNYAIVSVIMFVIFIVINIIDITTTILMAAKQFTPFLGWVPRIASRFQQYQVNNMYLFILPIVG